MKDIEFYAKIRLNATKQFQEMISENFEETSDRIEKIDKENLLKNPPEGINELLALIEE